VTETFTWHDSGRTIRFGRGTLATAGELLGDGYALLATPRTLAMAPAVAAAAGSVHEVADGYVEQLSAALLDDVPASAELVVALGGGRVVDTVKAVVAGRGHGRAAAIPTTLSAAEMTRVHRLPDGVAGAVPVRAAIVLNDPALSASQPVDELAASAANALGHAAEGAVTDRASPVPRMAAAEAVRLLAGAFAGEGETDRDALALAALLSGWTIDSTHYGLHHVLSQTMVRAGGIWHGHANAAMLPHSLAAVARRSGDRMLPGVEELARDLARRAGAERLRDLGVPREALEQAADAAAGRDDLDRTPPRADRDELRAIYEAAW
jgi:alcohol dehydrogenase class IV